MLQRGLRMNHRGMQANVTQLYIIADLLERHPGIPNEAVTFPEWDDLGEQSSEDVEQCMRVRNAAEAILGCERQEGVATLEELGALLQYIAVRIEAIETL